MSTNGRFDFAAPKGYCPESECSNGIGYSVFTQRGAAEAGRYAQPDLQKIDGCDCLRERLRFHNMPQHRTRDGAIERLVDALCWDDIAALAFWHDVRHGSLWVRPQVANLVFSMGTPRPPSYREPEESRRAHAAIEALHTLATADHARAVADLHDDNNGDA